MDRTMSTFSQNSSLWHPRQQYGNYQLLKLLGRGGFAEVYLGKHVYLGTRAAIKIVRSLDDFDVQAFFAEARLAAQLRHPHIIRVLDFDLEEGEPFLVMDYAPNGSVRCRYQEGSLLPISLILDYVDQIADALHYLHSRKLIHRDIKPENLLLDRHDQVLLSDFGITIAVPKTFSGDQVVVGTAGYIAPEQIEGRPCPASDQYALGVVVYEWLSGARPFQGSRSQIVQQHLFAQPPSLCEQLSDVPPAVEEVVLRALAKDPEDRFEDVEDFAVALRHAFEKKPWVQRPPDLSPPQTPSKRQGQVMQLRSERNQQRTGGEGGRRLIWKEIAGIFFLDLLVGAALWCIFALLAASPLFIEAVLALCMVLLPVAGSLMRKNTPLLLLTCSLAVVAALAALAAHNLVFFNVIYTALLILSLLIAFAVSVSES
jgi:serine/threonine protein kinase